MDMHTIIMPIARQVLEWKLELKGGCHVFGGEIHPIVRSHDAVI